MIQIGHKIKKIVILVLVGDPFKPEVIRASANLFEKRTRNRMGKKNLSKSDLKKKNKKCWCLSNFDPFTSCKRQELKKKSRGIPKR